MSAAEKDVVWLGDSLAVLQKFPKAVRIDLGNDLRRLQIGELPLDFKPIKTVATGVKADIDIARERLKAFDRK